VRVFETAEWKIWKLRRTGFDSQAWLTWRSWESTLKVLIVASLLRAVFTSTVHSYGAQSLWCMRSFALSQMKLHHMVLYKHEPGHIAFSQVGTSVQYVRTVRTVCARCTHASVLSISGAQAKLPSFIYLCHVHISGRKEPASHNVSLLSGVWQHDHGSPPGLPAPGLPACCASYPVSSFLSQCVICYPDKHMHRGNQ
jgi:hypothetical protein